MPNLGALRMCKLITQSQDLIEHVSIVEIAYVCNLGLTRDNTVAGIVVV